MLLLYLNINFKFKQKFADYKSVFEYNRIVDIKFQLWKDINNKNGCFIITLTELYYN